MTQFDPQADAGVREFVDGVRATLGERLVAVVLYGSAARGDWQPKTSDVNLMVVLADLEPGTLRGLTEPFRRWTRRGQPPPRIFSPALLREAGDVFPLELLDLRSHRVVLEGSDPFAEADVDRADLRLQLERELREKMMRLREGIVLARERRREVERLLTDSYTTFIALFRGGLWLMGAEPPRRNAEVAEAFCRAAGLDSAPFVEVDRLKRGESPDDDPATLFSRYYSELTRAVAAIDRLDASAPGGAS